jgi:hypothetical protein
MILVPEWKNPESAFGKVRQSILFKIFTWSNPRLAPRL